MFRSYKQQTSRKVSRKKHLPDEQTSSPSSAPQHPTIQMQSLIGNHAMQRMIQRMPTETVIINTLGKPKKNVGFIKNSTKYKLVLDRVRSYDFYLSSTTLGGDLGAIKGQMQQIITLLNAIKTAVNAYDGDTGKKAAYMLGLKPQIQQEMNKVSLVITKYMTGGIPDMKPKLSLVMSGTNQFTPQLHDKDKLGGDKGGSSEVTEYGGTNSGYFKANKDTLYNPAAGGQDPNMVMGPKMRELKKQLGDDKGMEVFNSMSNEYNIGVDLVGIDPENARMAKRDVATSRLNEILNQNVIAKAQLAVQHIGGQKVEGSLMEKAKGLSAMKLMEQEQVYDPGKKDLKDPNKANQINLQDPMLMQSLSKLQFIDLLSFQVDRNRGNYFIQRDQQGKVLGVTGIDNDYSFGTNSGVSRWNQELPGMSRFVDEDIAKAILELDPELLRLAMMDLLTDTELNALLERLEKLKQFLKPLQDTGKLLKPHEWTPAISQGLLDEQKSYYSTMITENNKVKGRHWG
ncbi:MAG: hypothetical protein LCI00_11500 [Chloroflexi bacterium]|nr:hypothetical protein [Chloroflexota bacterium]